MEKKKVQERELTGGEVAIAVLILLFSLVVLGDVTDICRVIIAFVIMIADIVLIHKAKCSKKGV